jgi:hypothetical protein
MLNVLLDIDDTLLRFVKRDIWERIPNRMDFITIFYKDCVFMLRPNIANFLNFLFSKYNVSIWTWGSADYAEIVSNILTDSQPHKFKDILSLEDSEIASVINETGGKDLRYIWYHFSKEYSPDFIREKIKWRNACIDTINQDRAYEQKPLFLKKPMTLFSEYTPKNTILIDDALHNLVEPNMYNMILVNPFGSRQDIPIMDPIDNEFDRIAQILETVDDHHQSLIDDHVPLMFNIHGSLPLLEYQKYKIKNLQHSLS